MNNREWLNSLTNEELANWLCDNLYNSIENRYYGVSQIKFAYSDSILGLQEWLRQEMKDWII